MNGALLMCYACVSVCVLPKELGTQRAVQFAASFFLCLLSAAVYQVCITPSSKPFIRFSRHGTIAAAFQGIPVVTPTNGASLCVCVSPPVCHPEHNPDDSNSHFL